MKTVRFSTHHLRPVISGEKIVTLRAYSSTKHDFAKEEIFIGSFENEMEILLIATADTKTTPFKNLSHEEVYENGYASKEDAFLDLKEKYYPELEPQHTCAVIRFEVLTIGNVPVVKSVKQKPIESR